MTLFVSVVKTDLGLYMVDFSTQHLAYYSSSDQGNLRFYAEICLSMTLFGIALNQISFRRIELDLLKKSKLR